MNCVELQSYLGGDGARDGVVIVMPPMCTLSRVVAVQPRTVVVLVHQALVVHDDAIIHLVHQRAFRVRSWWHLQERAAS